MARLHRTPLARQDIKDVGRYIAQESQSRDVALRFLKTIAAKSALVARNPRLGEECRELGPDVRRFLVGNYVVYYQQIVGGIELLRILHGSRDIQRVWTSE